MQVTHAESDPHTGAGQGARPKDPLRATAPGSRSRVMPKPAVQPAAKSAPSPPLEQEISGSTTRTGAGDPNPSWACRPPETTTAAPPAPPPVLVRPPAGYQTEPVLSPRPDPGDPVIRLAPRVPIAGTRWRWSANCSPFPEGRGGGSGRSTSPCSQPPAHIASAPWPWLAKFRPPFTLPRVQEPLTHSTGDGGPFSPSRVLPHSKGVGKCV